MPLGRREMGDAAAVAEMGAVMIVGMRPGGQRVGALLGVVVGQNFLPTALSVPHFVQRIANYLPRRRWPNIATGRSK